MEFPFSIIEIFQGEISVIDKQLSIIGTSIKNLREIKDQIGEVLDVIGEASANAQKLTHPITTKEKFAASDDRIYIMRSSEFEKHQNKVVGFLKVGTKNLFLFDLESNYHELQPLCVLDFYVHESMQRQGCGKQLFEFMLKNENISPNQLAINRPSSKLLSFLCKHYNLKSRIPQINNFVVFSNFFQGRQVPRNRRQWKHDDGHDSSRIVGNTPYSRLTSLGPRSKSQVPTLPNIDSRHSDGRQSVLNSACNNSASLDGRSNDCRSKADTIRIPFSMENQDLHQQRGKCFSTEVFNLKAQPGSNIFGENKRYPMNSSSAGHLNLRRRQDTSWNIFGVSSASSTCHGSKNSSMLDRKRSTLLW